MRIYTLFAIVAAMIVGLAASAPAAEPKQETVQTKTGTVKKVDLAAKEMVVMVARELTFTVTETTKIVQGDAAKKLADIKVDAKVTVDYTRQGDTRTAKKIEILPEK
jgi:hypothetical protein